MNEAAFRVEGVVKRFGRRSALDGVSLEVPRGEVLVLLGENGAGKSTLLRLALGLLRPTAGRVEVEGLDPVRKASRVREIVGYVPDRPDACGWMTAVDLFAFTKAHQRAWSDDRAREAVEALRVPTDVPFKAMSKGQAMKAMLAAALAHDPRVLLLDEPFSGLDPVVREEVLRGVLGHLRADGRTVLVATHELDAAARVADRVAVLSQGKVVRQGTLAEVAGDGAEPADAPGRLHDVLAAAVAAGGGR